MEDYPLHGISGQSVMNLCRWRAMPPARSEAGLREAHLSRQAAFCRWSPPLPSPDWRVDARLRRSRTERGPMEPFGNQSGMRIAHHGTL